MTKIDKTLTSSQPEDDKKKETCWIDADALLHTFNELQYETANGGKEYSCAFRNGAGRLSTEWRDIEDLIESIIEGEVDEVPTATSEQLKDCPWKYITLNRWVLEGDYPGINTFFNHCVGTLTAKTCEYAKKGELFQAFQEAARIEGITPEQALWGFALKHITSLSTMIHAQAASGNSYPLEMWREKCGDLVNYLALLYAMEAGKSDA